MMLSLEDELMEVKGWQERLAQDVRDLAALVEKLRIERDAALAERDALAEANRLLQGDVRYHAQRVEELARSAAVSDRLRARAEFAERALVEERSRGLVEAAEKALRAPEQLDLLNRPTEAQKRDAALDLLEEHRSEVVELARGVARSLALQHGFVTATGVLQEMRARGYGEMLDVVDPRFMGVVFRRGWEQTGWAQTGSHKRRQPVWRLRP